MEVQIKMERKRTTTYITAKKRIGCRAPTEVKFLAFIQYRFRFSKKLDLVFYSYDGGEAS